MALEQATVINTLKAPKAYTRPWYLRIDKKCTTTSIGHKMATYNSKADAETGEPRLTHEMDLTAEEQKEIADTVCNLLYKFQKTREDFAEAKDA